MTFERRWLSIIICRPIDKEHVRYAGDYPDVGIVTYDHKDPYENWSYPFYRRNWGEMVIFNYFLIKIISYLFYN